MTPSGPQTRRRPRRRDEGTTFVELLVAIVLLGTVGTGVLTAMRASVIGTRLERDHSKAFQWLQSAEGVLQASGPPISCSFDPVADAAYSSGEEKLRRTYENRIRSGVVNPPGWSDSQIIVLAPVKIWDGTRYWDPALAPKPCYDTDGYRLRLVTLQVKSPDGEIIETVQVVKRD